MRLIFGSDAVRRFLREAQAAASLRSPHVVQILDHGVDAGTPYIAMELLEGESLGQRLERVGKLSPAETARILTHVARGIGRAHDAGIVHRDLKPDNVFLVHNDDEDIAKVLDFGIAKFTESALGMSVSSGTRTGSMMGTPYYMSPEQVEGEKGISARSDIWAIGVIAFECLLGKRPFDGETLGGLLLSICTRALPVPSQVGTVPSGFDAWFERACARTPDMRFSSARDAVAALRSVCDGSAQVPLSLPRTGDQAVQPAGTASDTRTPGLVLTDSSAGFAASQAGIARLPGRRPLSRAPKLAMLGGGTIVVIGGAAALFAYRGTTTEPPAVARTESSALPSSVASVPRPSPAPPPSEVAVEPEHPLPPLESAAPRTRPHVAAARNAPPAQSQVATSSTPPSSGATQNLPTSDLPKNPYKPAPAPKVNLGL